ncbi:MAG: hypothetical protein HND53_14270 [Proteobacteria bacterium]|nr:hypothetical protein [Pseudomonadota bacterium]NOG61656.1 hypothetical protein [Pseudomonadota bacterium]
MSMMLDKLHQEHINITKLIDVLEKQINSYQENGSINLQLIRDISDYIIHYPDLYHHPKEDLVFELLRHKDKQIEPVINRLLNDHKILYESATSLSRELNRLKDSSNAEILVKQLKNYIALSRSHMDVEEAILFPRAKELLTENDWQQVETGFNYVEDPVFGKVIYKQYENILNSIIDDETG